MPFFVILFSGVLEVKKGTWKEARGACLLCIANHWAKMYSEMLIIDILQPLERADEVIV